MSNIFLSYRRSDSPQACRVYDWLVRRFGSDAVFMDVAAIPIAVDFPEYLGQAVTDSKVLIALIGAQWLTKIHDDKDYVRIEIESALAKKIPVLPVLIGTTPMLSPDQLPASISSITRQNAAIVGVSHDFDTHMQALLPTIESIIRIMATESVVLSDPAVIDKACEGFIQYLRETFPSGTLQNRFHALTWEVAGTDFFSRPPFSAVSLYLHRVARLAELLELHFILSFWTQIPREEYLLAGWTMRQLEQTPIIPDKAFYSEPWPPPEWNLKIRRSDEDPRQVWKMITDTPLRLSLAYVGTISPNRPVDSNL